ncbi:fimbrial biogenesis outer membrane usher protein [Saccharophagus sp. K07]|uniref:fimbria/pilus outer membrane usher protein n=1 Tax=Saccharophagus sp. K07 TaxID=2283636 RepID=UPI001651D036|nr:fimbria/pilus outer membrane usher protein [Saccharophagus sp. K07]MBC6907028.1 fimbrial biogenesis outer membrane usher protein [Saccharophagus sp. K07]
MSGLRLSCIVLIGTLFPLQALAEVFYLELVINGKPVAISAVNKQESKWFIPASDLRAAGVKLHEASLGFVDVTNIEGASVSYDEAQQRLLITLPASYLPEQTVGPKKSRPQITPGNAGAMLNYDLYTTRTNLDRSWNFSAWHDLVLFGSSVFVTSTGIYRDDPALTRGEGYTRFDTRLQYDNTDQLWTLSLGDVINGGNYWTRSLRMGGLRFSRDYSIDPQFVTYPVPEFFGEAALPSSVELLINDRKRLKEDIEPGPFVVDVPTYISGAGVAQVVTKDVLGRTQIQEVNFYVSSQLLKPGLFDYDVSVGYPREHFGLMSDQYDNHLATSTRLRYGATDWFTPEVVAQTYKDLHLLGAGTTWRLGRFGILELSANHSDTDQNNAWQKGFGYQYQRGGMGFALRNIIRDRGYADLSRVGGANPALREVQASVSFSQGELGNFSFGYFRLDYEDRNPSTTVVVPQNLVPSMNNASIFQPSEQQKERQKNQFFNFTWSRGFSRGVNVLATAARDFDSSKFDWSLSISFPVDYAGYFSASRRENQRGSDTKQVSLQKTAPYAGGLGWHFSYLDTDPVGYHQMMFNWRDKYANTSIGSYGSNLLRNYYLGVTGGLVMMDWNVFATREIYDSFALVDTSLPDVPVYVGQRFAGNTNRKGKALVTDLSSYATNKISIDPINLPAQTIYESTEQYVVPARRGGLKLTFPVQTTHSALVILVNKKGEYLPMGAQIRVQRGNESKNADERVIVGWDGEIFLQDFDQPVDLVWEEGNCVVLAVPPDLSHSDLPRIGPVICQTYRSSKP